MDDMLIQAASASGAFLHAQITILVLMCLGWSINWEKSNLVPSQQITHSGFVIDSNTMTVSCPEDKMQCLVISAPAALSSGHLTVHDLERLLGRMESVRPVTPMAAVWYRSLQKQLSRAKSGGRRPNKIIALSLKSMGNLAWWVSKSGFKANCTAHIQPPAPTLHIWSDASTFQAGAHCSRGSYTQREWSESELESDLHINLLEL